MMANRRDAYDRAPQGSPLSAGRFVCAGPSPYLYTATTVDPPPSFMEGTACGENGFGSFFQLYLPRQMNQEGL